MGKRKITPREHACRLISSMAEEHVLLIDRVKGSSPSMDLLLEQHNTVLETLAAAVQSLPEAYGQEQDLVGRRMYFREGSGYGDLQEPVTVTAEYQRGVRKYVNVVDAAGTIAHNVLAAQLKPSAPRGKLKAVAPAGEPDGEVYLP